MAAEIQEKNSWLEKVAGTVGYQKWMWRSMTGRLLAIVIIPATISGYVDFWTPVLRTSYEYASPYIAAISTAALNLSDELIMFGDASAMPATRGKDLDHPVAFLVPKTRIDPEGVASLGSVPTDLGVQAFARSLWRITRPEFSPIEALSATQLGGRWNSPGASMLYTAEDPLGALEELMMAVRGQRVIADFLPLSFCSP